MRLKAFALCTAIIISPVHPLHCKRSTLLHNTDHIRHIGASFIGLYDFAEQLKSFCKGPTGKREGDAIPLLESLAKYFKRDMQSELDAMFQDIKNGVTPRKTGSSRKPTDTATSKTAESTVKPHVAYLKEILKSLQGLDNTAVYQLVEGRVSTVEEVDKARKAVMSRFHEYLHQLETKIDLLKDRCAAMDNRMEHVKQGHFKKTCERFCNDALEPAANAVAVLYKWIPYDKHSFLRRVEKFKADGSFDIVHLDIRKAAEMLRRTAAFCGIEPIHCETRSKCNVKKAELCLPDEYGYHIGGPSVCV